MNQVRQLAIAVTIPALLAVTADAQGPGRPTAGIFGGVTVVNGDFKEEVGNGWLLGGLVKMRAYGPFDVRLDGTYVKLGSKEIVDPLGTVSTDASIVFGTLNALVNLGPDSASYPGDNSVSPYLLAGAGLYELDYKADCTGACTGFTAPEKKSHFGMNAGFGATAPLFGIRTFAEARYHHISRSLSDGSSRKMILVSAGVKFR
jgi:opacity protein-like surface antigen